LNQNIDRSGFIAEDQKNDKEFNVEISPKKTVYRNKRHITGILSYIFYSELTIKPDKD